MGRSVFSQSDTGRPSPFQSVASTVPCNELPPPRSTSVKRLCYFLASLSMNACLLLQALPALATSRSLASFIGMCVLTAVLAGSTVLSAYLAHGAYRAKFSAHQESDFTLLLLGLITPGILLLARWNPLPTSDDTRANCLITFAFLLRLGALMDMPPGHSMVQFFLSYPVLTFLDYHRRCHQPLRYPDTCAFYTGCEVGSGSQEGSCSHCCSVGSFMHHMCSRGLFTLAVGLVSMAVPVIIGIKKTWESRGMALGGCDLTPLQAQRPSCSGSSSEPSAAVAPELPPIEVPMETLGVHIVSAWGLVPLIQQLALRLEEIARSVDESVLVSLVCIPVGLYYLGFALLARVMPKSFSSELVTSDEWLLAMSVFFVLGRESCSMDMLPYVQLVQSKLAVSQNILRDVLPEHVVNLLISAEDDNEQQLVPPPTPGMEDTMERPPSGASDIFEDISNMASKGLQAGNDFVVRATGTNMRGRASADDKSSHSQSLKSASSVRSSVAWVGSSGKSPSGGGKSDAGVASVVRTLKLAENHDCITVFVSDICGFSSWAHELPPEQVMSTLNTLYSRLDDIILNEFPSLYKVETIGDAYVVAGNLVCHDRNHAATILRFAMRAQQEAARVPRPDMGDGTPVQLRIGLHSGSAVSGIVGKLRRRFCMFGETVDLAMRTETTCPPGCIQLTAATHKLVDRALSTEVVFRDRGEVPLQGLSKKVQMYLAVSKDLLVRTRMLTAAGIDL